MPRQNGLQGSLPRRFKKMTKSMYTEGTMAAQPPSPDPPLLPRTGAASPARTSYALAGLVVTCMFAIATVLVFNSQLIRLKTSHYNAEQLLPMCKTIESVLDACSHDRSEVLKALEQATFRTTWITVFSLDGEVWADSLTPTQGRLPMAPSASQRESFKVASDAGASKEGPAVLTRRFGNCARSGCAGTISLAATRVKGDLVLVMQSCGRDDP